MDIKFIKRADIDKVKWNSCVHYAINGNVFGYIWYLDHIAKDWDALIEGDYETVFPLIWKDGLFNRQELYQPGLMRETGIYSINVLSQARIGRFLEAIPEKYRKLDIHLNEQNRPPEGLDLETEELTNYQLFLNQPYEELADKFSRPMLEKLQQAEDEGIVLTSSVKPEKIAEFYRRYGAGDEYDFHGLQRIMYNVLHRGWGFASAAMNTDADILAVNFFIYSHKKVMSLVPLATPEGQSTGALPYLMNGLIRSHANKPVILDFNGTNDKQLATDLGGRPNPYYRIRRNRLVLGLF